MSRSGANYAAEVDAYISVKEHGAIGNGIADDTAAIQAAITASQVQTTASGAGIGRVVFFPAGRYKVTSTILVPTGTTLQGSSGGIWSTSKGESRIFMAPGFTATLISNIDTVGGDSNIEIRNLKLLGAGGNTLQFLATNAVGVDGSTCRRIVITGCYISNTAGNGIVFSDTQVSWVKDNYISAVTGHAIHFKSSYDNIVTGNQIDTYQDTTDTFGGNGIHFDNTGGSLGYSDHNIINNNFIFLCDNGIRITHGRRNAITSNRINTCNFGVNLQGFGGATNIQENLISANVFYDHGYKTGGVHVFIDGTSQHNTVSGNLFTKEHPTIISNYAVQTASATANNVIIGNTAKGMSNVKSFQNVSSNENTYSNNTVIERGRRVQSFITADGAATFDAALTDSFQVSLQANATSSTLTNGHQGQQVTISWLQDVTGARTYAWPTNCRFAGAAPTDTTANRQTSVTFVRNGTLWMETSRAVGVG